MVLPPEVIFDRPVTSATRPMKCARQMISIQSKLPGSRNLQKTKNSVNSGEEMEDLKDLEEKEMEEIM